MAIAAVLVPEPLPSSVPGRLALAGLLLLTAWTAASVSWAPIGGRAQDDVQRLVLYLGVFIAAVALLRGPLARRWLEPSLALGTLVVVAYGLSERLLPGLVELDRSSAAAGRLEQPLTYWNAYGLVAAIGFVLAVRIAGDLERPQWLRAAAAASGVVIGLACYLTFARGALAAAAAGLLVLVAFAPAGRAQLRVVGIVLAPTFLAALAASRYPTIKSLEAGEPGDVLAGLLMLIALVLLAALAAVATLRRPRRELPLPELPVSRRTAVLAAGAVVLVVATLTAAALEGKPETVSPDVAADPARLGSIDTNRYRYWDVAVETWARNPIVGVGSGGFSVEWLKQRDRVDKSGDAHSIYVETAAELGLVGMAFLLMFLGGTAMAVLRLHRVDPSAATGLAGGLAAWWLHAGLDWDWEMPAAGLLMVVLAAAAVAWSEQRTGAAVGARRPAREEDGAASPAGSAAGRRQRVA